MLPRHSPSSRICGTQERCQAGPTPQSEGNLAAQDERDTYVSHVGGVQLSAGGGATAAAVRLLQAETLAVQRVNVRVCKDETPGFRHGPPAARRPKRETRQVWWFTSHCLRGGEDRETQSVVGRKLMGA